MLVCIVCLTSRKEEFSPLLFHFSPVEFEVNQEKIRMSDHSKVHELKLHTFRQLLYNKDCKYFKRNRH